MKLIGKQEIELIKKYQKLNKGKKPMEKNIPVHLFNPAGAGNWYVYEYSPKTQIAFGYVSLFNDWNDEWGSFAIWELEELQLPLGLKIERDLYWKPKPLKDISHLYINKQEK